MRLEGRKWGQVGERKGRGRETEPQTQKRVWQRLPWESLKRKGGARYRERGREPQPITEPESKLTKVSMYRNTQCRNLSLVGYCNVEGMSAVRKC